LLGITPSTTVKVQARMWSAMTFSDGDAGSQSPAPAASTAAFAAASRVTKVSIS
jgi:hypothetical protein